MINCMSNLVCWSTARLLFWNRIRNDYYELNRMQHSREDHNKGIIMLAKVKFPININGCLLLLVG